MSNLTIDQILLECTDENTEDFDMQKEASTTSESTADDVGSMINLLKTASVEESTEEVVLVEPRGFEEKLAEALILTDALQEAASPATMFKQAALERGFSEEEIDNFLEKQALDINWSKMKKPVLYAAGGLGLLGAGEYHGRRKGRSRGRKEGFKVGRTVQYLRDKAAVRRMLQRRQGNAK